MVKWISDNLNTNFLGKKIIYFKEINSTYKFARKIIDYEKTEGTVIVAEKQTEEISPAGGVYLSIILKPKNYILKSLKINLIAQLSIFSTIKKISGIETFFRWPDEIILNNKRIAHIFSETADKFLIVGISVNTNISLKKFPQEIRETSTSLKKELGKEISNYKFLRILLEEFEKNYFLLKENEEKIFKMWKEKCYTLKKRVKIISEEKELKGEAIDIDKNGFLLIKGEDGKIKKVKKEKVILLPTLIKNENF